MVSEEELEKFVGEDLAKDISQINSIDPSVEQHMQEMGYLWKSVNDKIQEDNTCFKCKEQLRKDDKDLESKSFILRASGTDKGVVAFISLCQKCHNDELSKQEVKDEGKNNE